ncbi:hypothetical protein LTR10_020990 [Elasticomyces elasticus]|uniref:Uncharacterized protein n=1 Tax=Exophiala sideris TaxID=1016849 RepID=A0ABR0JLX2_9EURO|nr:hypothetical protein LTR10_020990 [Elasticomyces elasticus]KAK5036499.1 hypothetical protein LTS07_002226 [Exophiala sideris]KAK5041672.1 hypothetical protein LTR13_002339 [Exophiala sideris]KAK5066882.1 hypothetical protein LTR69_002230 [Exophiala sideris]KAK5184941.1 hypothetical protein LTR44_002787 [Eurotiomycetes sp. CCFEE 6388]
MASQRAQAQLNKQLVIDIAGTTPANVQAPPTLLNRPAQPPFPAYRLGYNAAANVTRVNQIIPPPPADRQGLPHPYDMLAEDNLHPALFQIEPIPNTLANVQIPLLVNQQTGQVETNSTGRAIRYFWHMPRWVAIDVSGMLMELWLRLDPRVEMRDILDRINTGNRAMPGPNVFNMRRNRFRLSINVPSQNTGRQMPSAVEVEMLGLLTSQQILLNTSMLVDLHNNRLLQPVLANDRSTLGYVDAHLPIDHFLVAFPMPIPIPSNRQLITLQLRHRLQTLAMLRGLGNGAHAYQTLPINLQPGWWNERRQGGNVRVDRIVDIDNLTHEEFVQGLLAQYPAGAQQSARRTGQRSRRQMPAQRQQRQQPQQQQQQPRAPAMQPAVNNVVAPAPAPMPIDPRLLVANPVPVPVGLTREIRTPDGAIHAYVEDVHQALYR